MLLKKFPQHNRFIKKRKKKKKTTQNKIIIIERGIEREREGEKEKNKWNERRKKLENGMIYSLCSYISTQKVFILCYFSSNKAIYFYLFTIFFFLNNKSVQWTNDYRTNLLRADEVMRTICSLNARAIDLLNNILEMVMVKTR